MQCFTKLIKFYVKIELKLVWFLSCCSYVMIVVFVINLRDSNMDPSTFRKV